MGPFRLPELPSLPSVKSFINVSPPLVYPSPESKRRSRASSAASDHTVNDGPCLGGWGAGRAGGSRMAGGNEETPTRGRIYRHPSSSLLSYADPLIPEEAEWEPLPPRRHQLHRRNSLGDGDNDTPHASPSRPQLGGHRRSQSAVPTRRNLLVPLSSPGLSPHGKLHDYARHPLASASASAISLPTLAEICDSDGSDPGGAGIFGGVTGRQTGMDLRSMQSSPEQMSPVSSFPHGSSLSSLTFSSTSPSPMVRARPRPGSRTNSDSSISPISPVSLPSVPHGDQAAVASLRLPPAVVEEEHRHRRSYSSVPPPQAMHPPAMRPPSSPRAWRGGVGPRPARSRRESTASVSDVAVMATWSFPASPPRDPVARPGDTGDDSSTRQGHAMSKPSEGLRQRLRALSNLDTMRPMPSAPASASTTTSFVTSHTGSRSRHPSLGGPILSSASVPTLPGLSLPSPSKPDLHRASTSIRPLSKAIPPRMTHRHSLSSPSPLMPVPPGPSVSGTPFPQAGHHTYGRTGSPSNLDPLPTRHSRRPTVSKLRQPNPLSMPMRIPVPRIQTAASSRSQLTPASSPGSMKSMISDFNSTVSDDRTSEGDKASLAEDGASIVSDNGPNEFGQVPMSRTDTIEDERDTSPVHGLIINIDGVTGEDTPESMKTAIRRASTPDFKAGGTILPFRANQSTLSLQALERGSELDRSPSAPGFSQLETLKVGEAEESKWSFGIGFLRIPLPGRTTRRSSQVEKPDADEGQMGATTVGKTAVTRDGRKLSLSYEPEEEEEEEGESYISWGDI